MAKQWGTAKGSADPPSSWLPVDTDIGRPLANTCVSVRDVGPLVGDLAPLKCNLLISKSRVIYPPRHCNTFYPSCNYHLPHAFLIRWPTTFFIWYFLYILGFYCL